MAEQGAIAAIVAFIVGVWFAIPSQANIGYMIVEALINPSTPESFLTLVPLFKLSFNILGIAIIVGDIVYISDQVKSGNF